MIKCLTQTIKSLATTKHWNKIKRGRFTSHATSIIQREYNEQTGESLQLKQYSNDAMRRLMKYLIFSLHLENFKTIKNSNLIDW